MMRPPEALPLIGYWRRRWLSAVHRIWTTVALLSLALQGQAAQTTLLRLKTVATQTGLHQHDIRTDDGGTSQQQIELSLRGQWQQQWQGFEGLIALEANSIWGEGLARRPAGVRSPGSSANDQPNAFDLATELSSGSEHTITARIDRLAVGYHAGSWSIRAGRDAISWGNGLVFNPLDLFSPFAPAQTDRDFKKGQDMILVQKLFTDGSDLQLLAVARRDADGHRSVDSGSIGAKWRWQFRSAEINLLTGRHDRDIVGGMGFSVPVSDAVLRLDLLATQLDDDPWGPRIRYTGILNADYNFLALGHNVYVFGELYFNGFGMNDMPVAFSEISEPLQVRLQRGELFTVGRRYAAAGGNLQWSARLTQSALWLQSLDDGSRLLQTTLHFEPDDNQSLEAGITWGSGKRGHEFDGLRLFPGAASPTLGGGLQFYVRWIVYL